MGLLSETQSNAIEERVVDAAHALLGEERDLRAFFEHGHWWVEDFDSGAIWSAYDASGPRTCSGFGFEQVTGGDNDE